MIPTILRAILDCAGRLTMSWMSSGFLPAKCALMTPSAGAMAAPAITVRSDMERMVAVTIRDTFFMWFVVWL